MKFFPKARKKQSLGLQFIRGLAMVFIFVIAGILFWKHNQNTMDKILAKQAVWDQTRTLSDDQKASLQTLSRSLRSRYGIRFRLSITKNALYVPRLDSKTLFFGICPSRQQVIIVLPPLLRHAVSKKFIEYLEFEHFNPYWKEKNWIQGLGSALNLLFDRLQELEHGAPPA